MRILWLSWKDEGHPEAGGAEKVSGELRRHLVQDGHEVVLVTAHYPQSSTDEVVDGVAIHRAGGRFSVYLRARRYCRASLRDWPDVVIDEMNTIPFAASLYFRHTPVFLLAYQLAREVWFYQMRFPISLIGYILEPFMLFILARTGYRGIITESESTRQDMGKYGFKPISLFPVWLDLPPLKSLDVKKYPTQILSLGAVRPMKRTLDAVKAFEVARGLNPSLTMCIAGDMSSPYASRVRDYLAHSPHKNHINLLGRVSNEERLRLMRESAVILVTSIKEGWGLIVTEANSQGTPAVVYDADGLRDSVKADITGLITKRSDPFAMGQAVAALITDTNQYTVLRENGWQFSKEFTISRTYQVFTSIIMGER